MTERRSSQLPAADDPVPIGPDPRPRRIKVVISYDPAEDTVEVGSTIPGYNTPAGIDQVYAILAKTQAALFYQRKKGRKLIAQLPPED